MSLILAHKGAIPELQTQKYTKGIWVKLITTEIRVYEEFIVYDFSGIVGTVGGSLGLFIGFSFMDFVLLIIRSTMTAWGKRCKPSTGPPREATGHNKSLVVTPY